MKKVVLIIFGGKSVEHDISVITAVQTMKNLPKKFLFLPVYIDKNSNWWIADNLMDIETFKNFKKFAKNKKEVVLGKNTLFAKKRNKFVKHCQVLAVLNCCHGHFGEDGSLQGLLNACEIACTSCGVTSSALCMDKTLMKDVLKANEIPTAEYSYFFAEKNSIKLPKNLEFPVIVKPANLGSSIGISVCKNQTEYDEALELAFKFDKKVLVERLVQNLREFNCACFSITGQKFVSSVNEVKSESEIYSFEEKYLSSQSKNMSVDKKLSNKIKTLTEKVYDLFDCQGVVRVDFLYDCDTNTILVNEINTIPGSLAVYLFKDISAKEIVSALIEDAIQKFDDKKELISSFDSNAIEIYANFKPTSKK